MELEQMAPPYAVEERLSNLVGIVYSGHRIGTWGFSAETQQLHFSSALHENEMEMFFRLGRCRVYAFTKAQALEVPFLMNDQTGMIWLGEYATLHDGTRLLVLMGPMFYAGTSREYMDSLIQKLVAGGDIPAAQAAAYRTILADVPVISPQIALSYARMLHFSIHQKTLADEEIHFQTEKVQKDSTPASPEDRSWIDYELMHSQEEMILQCVRDGNLKYKELFTQLNFFVLDLPQSGNPLRSEANKLASGAALCRRAAIEGGLSPKVAIDLEAKYLFAADKLTKVTDLRALTLQMMDDFIRHVHKLKAQADRSRHIQECCEYIATHLTDDLSIQRIAKEIGYTEYYLTRKFRKETGMRLTEYIKNARLEYAKVCLLSTQMSVENISDLLKFNSRNYFTKMFREKTGKTPTEFRAQQLPDQ